MTVTDNFRTEFQYHVADQKEIPIYGIVDRAIEIDKLQSKVSKLPEEEDKISVYLQQVILTDPDTIDFLRTFVGVSDKRMYLELSYIFGKTKKDDNQLENILSYSIYDLKKHDIPLYIISFHFISPFPSNYDQCSPTESNRVQQIYYLGDVGENLQFRKEQRC